MVDHRLSLVGSHNLDPRSERLNSENAIVFDNPLLSDRLAHTFLEKDLLSSRRITPEEAAKFEKPETILKRFKKELAGLFESQM